MVWYFKEGESGEWRWGKDVLFSQDSRLMRQKISWNRSLKRGKILTSVYVVRTYVGFRECGSLLWGLSLAIILLTSTLHSVPNATGICCLWPSLWSLERPHVFPLAHCAGRMRPDDPGGKDLNLEEVLIGLELGGIVTLHGHPSKYPYGYCHRCNS